MQQRGKADLGINYAIVDELLEYIFRYQAKRILCLHEPKSFGRTGKEVRKICAARRRDVIALILLASDGGRQPRNGLKAQRAVQVKMQLYFGKRSQFHSFTITRARCPVQTSAHGNIQTRV